MMEREGRKVPEFLKNASELTGDLLFFHIAFTELDSERNHGMGLAKLPRSAIIAFANECGLNEDEKYELVYIMRKVDTAHLENLASKMPHNG